MRPKPRRIARLGRVYYLTAHGDYRTKDDKGPDEVLTWLAVQGMLSSGDCTTSASEYGFPASDYVGDGGGFSGGGASGDFGGSDSGGSGGDSGRGGD